MTANPFDYVDSINSNKKNLMKGTDNDLQAEKDYNPWMTNNSLSYFPDTIIHANTMNGNYHLDNKLQYMYLLNIVRPKKRFSKWVKKTVDSDLEAVAAYYGYNRTKAISALQLLSPDQLQEIKQKLDRGGTKK